METILIADCSPLVSRMIRVLIQKHSNRYEIIEASSCTEVLRLLSIEQVRYAVFDLLLEDGNIFMFIEELACCFRHTRVLIYSTLQERIYGRRLLEKGAKGYLNKHAATADLNKAINTLLTDHTYASSALIEDFFRNNGPAKTIDSLSDRELQIVECLAMGLNATQIAQKLNVNHSSVRLCQRTALRKMKVRNVAELAHKFLRMRE